MSFDRDPADLTKSAGARKQAPILVAIPEAAQTCISAVAGWRAIEGVEACRRGEKLWIALPAVRRDLLQQALSLQAAERFEPGPWGYAKPGTTMPVETPPDEAFQPIASVLVPDKLSLQADELRLEVAGEDAARPGLILRRTNEQRPTAALLLPLKELERWVTTQPVNAWQDLRCAALGKSALVLAESRHMLARAPVSPLVRKGFWRLEQRVLIPLGARLQPPLPEALLLDAWGCAPGDCVLVQRTGVARIPAEALAPITRAGVRLARKHAETR